MRRLLALLALALAPAAAAADEARIGDLVIQDAWARASIGQVLNSAAYMTVTNRGAETDRLVDAAAPAAARAELHTHLHEQGVVRMRRVEAIEVAPGEATVLQPGGLHVMVIDLAAPLEAGDRLALTLTFERAGEIDLDLLVRDARGRHHGH
jgi:periplasmic copper chaperone A